MAILYCPCSVHLFWMFSMSGLWIVRNCPYSGRCPYSGHHAMCQIWKRRARVLDPTRLCHVTTSPNNSSDVKTQKDVALMRSEKIKRICWTTLSCCTSVSDKPVLGSSKPNVLPKLNVEQCALSYIEFDYFFQLGFVDFWLSSFYCRRYFSSTSIPEHSFPVETVLSCSFDEIDHLIIMFPMFPFGVSYLSYGRGQNSLKHPPEVFFCPIKVSAPSYFSPRNALPVIFSQKISPPRQFCPLKISTT